MNYNRVLTTFTQEELELIEQYAATRGIKKATAVKELCIRGLELTPKLITDKNLELKNNLNKLFWDIEMNQEYLQQVYCTQQLALVTKLIDKGDYLQAMKVLKDLKQHTDNPNALVAIDKAIKDVSFYESNRNMNNYLNKRN